MINIQTLSELQHFLFENQDLNYKNFQSKLIPTINKEQIIGIKIPKIKKFAKEIEKSSIVNEFLENLPHNYYEENNLHAFLIANQNDYDKCIELLEKFLPFIDNWATCDCIRPKIFKNNLDKLIIKINEWVSSQKEFTVRFAVEMLMTYYLDSEFKNKYFDIVLNISSDKYYIKMMVAWYFATALAKQYDATIKILSSNIIKDDWIHNKTIQKAIESYRINAEVKDFLRTLKRK